MRQAISPVRQPMPAFKASVLRASAKDAKRASKLVERNQKRRAKGLPPLKSKPKRSRHHPDCLSIKVGRSAKCDCGRSEGWWTSRTSSRFVKVPGIVNVDHLPKNKRHDVAVKLHEVWERKRARARRMDAQTAEGHARLIALGYPDIVGEAKVLALAQPDYARGTAFLKKRSEVRVVIVPHDEDTTTWRKPGRDVTIRTQYGAVSAPTFEACMIELRTWLADERMRRAALHSKAQATQKRWPILSLQIPAAEHAPYIASAATTLAPNP